MDPGPRVPSGVRTLGCNGNKVCYQSYSFAHRSEVMQFLVRTGTYRNYYDYMGFATKELSSSSKDHTEFGILRRLRRVADSYCCSIMSSKHRCLSAASQICNYWFLLAESIQISSYLFENKHSVWDCSVIILNLLAIS